MFGSVKCIDCDRAIEQPSSGPRAGQWVTIGKPKTAVCKASRDGRHHPA